MLLLATEIWKTHGGVQRYMHIIARIIAKQDEPLHLLTLNDRDCDLPSGVSGMTVCCTHGSKLRFCLEAFRLASAGAARISIVGHIAFLPIAWALKKVRLIDKYILILHGFEAWGRLSWISRIGARNAAAVVATTNYTAREFCFHNRVDQARCKVIPLACGLAPSTIRLRKIVSECRLFTLTRLSNSDAYKGVDTVLHAVRRARSQGLNVTLDLVGSGDDAQRLTKLAHSLRLENAVHFRGTVPDEDLPTYFGESHIFVLPSRKEGFGIVFLEAMAAGLPCIAANHGGTPEVVEQGESGFLIEYGDVDQFVFYLRAMIESPELYETMSRTARRIVTEQFSMDVMAGSWTRLIAAVRDPSYKPEYDIVCAA